MRITFVIGALLTLPGFSYLSALDGIIKLNPGTAQTVLLVLMVNVIMLALIEIPLVSFTIAPEWTPTAIDRAKAWLSRHAQRAAVVGTGLVGALLILRGIVTLLS